ncbi:MAG: hypothetical protein P8Y12_06670 [Gammaproteobacteria bacterium]
MRKRISRPPVWRQYLVMGILLTGLGVIALRGEIFERDKGAT